MKAVICVMLFWLTQLNALTNFSLSALESQRFMADTSAANNTMYYSGNNITSNELQSHESDAKNAQHMLLEKENNLFNPDGTLGVTKDTKMQINPNGVNFNMGY